jgi:hypothetical protein
MKIVKFLDFITEELNDTPETYVYTALKQLKMKIDKMFDYKSEEENFNKDGRLSSSKEKSKSNTEKITLKDLGVKLESSEISKYSKQYDNLTIKFSDDEAWYNLLIVIELKEAIPKNNDSDFSHEDIKKCYIKFKKYDLNTDEVVGQLTKNVEIKSINEEFLINLKIELDEMFGGEDEEFSIETE